MHYQSPPVALLQEVGVFLPMRVLALLTCAVVLSACLPTRASITEFNGASDKVTVPILARQGASLIKADNEAARICKRVKKRAEFASSRLLDNYSTERLYLCL